MGAVIVRKDIYETFMSGPEQAIELFHGYTYSAHPVACAAGLATLDIYRREGLLTRAREMAAYWEEAVHSLKDAPHVIDLRNYGLIAGIELEPIAGKPTARAYQAFLKCFEQGVLVRTTGDIIALSPPLDHRARAHRPAVRHPPRGAWLALTAGCPASRKGRPLRGPALRRSGGTHREVKPALQPGVTRAAWC